MMKLLLITSSFYPNRGGVEEVIYKIASNLKSHKISVLTSTNKTSFNLGLNIGKEEMPGFSIYRIWMNVPSSLLGYIAFPIRFFTSILAITKVIRSTKPEVVNYHFPDVSSAYVLLIMLFYKAYYITNIHGNDLQFYAKKPIYNFIIRLILEKSQKIIINSTYMKNEFTIKYPQFTDKIIIIPNGIDVLNLNTYKADKPINEKYIMYVGRVVHKKGLDILLKAYNNLPYDDIKLVIEGNGDALEGMVDIAKSLERSDDIIFTKGRLEQNEKLAYMKNALFGVIPSRIEPFGIVALEFMALGTPVISSKTGGLAELLKNNYTCLFFEVENIDDLTGKMLEMINNDKLRFDIARNSLKESLRYDNKLMIKNYENIYLKKNIST